MSKISYYFFLISLVVVVSFFPVAKVSAAYDPKFDMNIDGQVNLNDVIYLINVILGNPNPTINVTPTASVTKTPTPTPTKSPTPTPVASSVPYPSITPAADIGPINNLVYRQGGIWITPDEIKQIPDSILTTSAWTNLVTYAKKPMNFTDQLRWTSGGAGSETDNGQALYARVIVGYKTNTQSYLDEAKAELDKIPNAIDKAIAAEGTNGDIKWAQRNIPFIAVSANILNYRPKVLTDALTKAVRVFKFPEGTVETDGMIHLPNKPAHGRWALLSVAYLTEDFATVNKVIKAQAKAMGEPNWGGVKNDHKFELTGLGEDDNWQTLQPGGKTDPIAIMPAGTIWNGHAVGGLFLADQYRNGNGPVWPPKNSTTYNWEGLGPNLTISWSADHLGYKDVFKWGNYALLRTLLWYYSTTTDGKTKWAAEGGDTWQVAGIMTFVKRPGSGITGTPTNLMPIPGSTEWPIPITDNSSESGRSMGFMYVTHYARLIGLQ